MLLVGRDDGKASGVGDVVVPLRVGSDGQPSRRRVVGWRPWRGRRALIESADAGVVTDLAGLLRCLLLKSNMPYPFTKPPVCLCEPRRVSSGR